MTSSPTQAARRFPASKAEMVERMTSLGELDGFEGEYLKRGETIPQDVREAIARRRAEIQHHQHRRK